MRTARAERLEVAVLVRFAGCVDCTVHSVVVNYDPIKFRFDCNSTALRPLNDLRHDRAAASRPEQAVREAATICPASCKLTFDLLTLKVVSESRVTWATSVPILVFLGLFVLDLDLMYATDRQTADVRQTDVRRASSLNAPA